MPWIADRQYGVFTARQAEEAGATHGQVSRRLASGEWRRLVGGGITAAARPVEPSTLMSAAVLTWPDAVVVGPVAGAFHGLPITLPAVVHVVRQCGSWRPRRGIVPRDLPLEPAEVERHGGLTVVRRDRAVVDTLAWSSLDQARRALTWAITRQMITREQLEERVERRPKARGNGQLRRLLHETRDGALSPAERRCIEILRRARLRGWECNARVTEAGRVLGVVDVLFAAERVVVEIDGRAAHSQPGAFQRDRTRQNLLVAAGYTVLRFTWEDLTRRPDDFVAIVRRALGR